MARIFIALDLSKECVDEIKRIQKILWKKTLFTGKLTESDNLHLTLKFLGEISDSQVEEIKKRLSEIKLEGFDCELGEIGVFNKYSIRIIWMKLNGKGIWKLQKEIDEKLSDLFSKEERFMSHIAIARVKNVNDKKGFLDYLKGVKPKKIRFHADRFFLKKSELLTSGPKYEDLKEYNLTKEKI
jgi:RNA 2',3'-cyclic 3'-phosphodiesterase